MTSSADTPSSSANFELSAYEHQRTTQAVIIDPRLSTPVVPRSLHHELMCPICLSLLDKTMAVDGCLHRFCSDCIITAFDYGYTDCPTCLQKNVIERPLHPDPHFDKLISTIYPNREKYDEHRIKALQKLYNKPCIECFLASINESIKIQKQNLLQQAKNQPFI